MKQLKKFAKRAQGGIGLALSLGLAIFVMAGFVIGLAAFNASTSDANATAFLDDGLLMFTNLGGQFGTIGTLIGVGILIAVIGGAFVVGRRVQGGGGF